MKDSLLLDELSAVRPAHAYLLCCAEPARLRDAASRLARALNCLEPDPRRRPCGECLPCREIASGVFADFTLSPAYKLSDVRAELSRLSERPYVGRLRVLALSEASEMTREAHNSLLKTLEEPPPAAVVILMVRNFDDVPATVSSRCRRIALGATPREIVATHLVSAGVEPRRAAFVAACAGGDEEQAAAWAARDGLDGVRAAAVAFVAGALGPRADAPLELIERHQGLLSSTEEISLWLAALGSALQAVITGSSEDQDSSRKGQDSWRGGRDSLKAAFGDAEWRTLGRLNPFAAASLARELHEAARAVRHHAQARLSLEAALLRFRGFGPPAGDFGSPHRGGS